MTRSTNVQRIPMALWGLMFVLVPLVYDSTVYEGALIPKLLVCQVFILLLFIYNGLYCSKYLPTQLNLLLLGFVFCHIQSVFVATNPTEALLQLSQYITLFTIPFLVVQTLSATQISQLTKYIPWVGLPIALIGIAQYHGLAFDTIPTNANPSATFFHRNAAAEYLIVVLPLAYIAFKGAQTHLSIATHGALLTLLTTYLIYTRTRGAWIGLVTAVIPIFIFHKITTSKPIPLKSNHTKVLIIILLATTILGNLPANISKTGSQHFDEKKSDVISAITSITAKEGHRGRPDLWYHTLQMIIDHPLRGVGLGNWQYHYPNYSKGKQVDVRAAPVRPHNDPLWIAAETGIPGFIFYLALIAYVMRQSWTLLKTQTPYRTLTLGLLTLIIAHVIESLFNFPRERVAPALFFWFAIGALTTLSSAQETRPSPNAHRILTIAMALICVGAIWITIKRYQYDQHHLRVHIAERQRNWQQVIPSAQHALRVGDFRPNTYIALGRAYYHLRDLDKAQEAYLNGLRLHPHSPNAYNNLGIVLRQKKQYAHAIEAFQKALDVFPGFHQAANNLGNVYRVQEQWDLAIAAYQRAMTLPTEPQIPYNLGITYLQKGELQKAQEHFLKSLNRNPNFAPARQALQSMGISQESLPTQTKP